VTGSRTCFFRELSMLDIILVGLGLAIFAAAIAYAYACDRL
jgi:hypothetical protein